MKFRTPEVAMHCRDGGKNDPILSVDFHPKLPIVATGGGDNETKVWRLDGDGLALNFLCGLSGHNKSVNTVRWSPDGSALATASDDGRICVWRLPSEVQSWAQITEANAKLLARRTLPGTTDVYDIDWSPDSKLLVSGAIDNTVVVWDIATGTQRQCIQDHSHYVQGVSWDPYQFFVATQSSDRSCRLYRPKPMDSKRKPQNAKRAAQQPLGCAHVLKKRVLAAPAAARPVAAAAMPASSSGVSGTGSKDEAAAPAVQAAPRFTSIFLDDSVPTFFRRLCWSPDGSLLFLPTAQCKLDDSIKGAAAVPTVMVYARGSWSTPAAHLPGGSKPSIAVRCCPVLFGLRSGGPDPWLSTTFRVVFAVATLDSVIVYDSQHPHPIAVLENLHFAQLTDLAWSGDGRTLVFSSSDGYCTVARFGPGELGDPLPEDKLPRVLMREAQPEAPQDIAAAAVAAAAAAVPAASADELTASGANVIPTSASEPPRVQTLEVRAVQTLEVRAVAKA